MKGLPQLYAVVAMLAVGSGAVASPKNVTPSPCQCEEPVPCCFFEQGLALEDDKKPPCDVKYNPAYNASAVIRVENGWDINVNASFIYWDVSQEGMSVTYIAPTSSNSGSVLNQSTGYKPGFKVGLGWKTNFDNWALDAEYTWLHQTQTTSASAQVVGFQTNTWYPVNLSAIVPTQQYAGAASSWGMHLDMLDLVLSRPYYQGTHLTISPMGGLRGLWLRQTMNIDLTGGANIASISSLNSSDSWAVGPKCGLDSHWLVWKGLRFEGDMGLSLLYTRYTSVKNTESIISNAGPLGTVTSASSDQSTVRPIVDMGLGLGYGAYAVRNKYFVDLSVRYDFSLFWNQNVMRNFSSQLQGVSGSIGDLNMHGLTIKLSLDF